MRPEQESAFAEYVAARRDHVRRTAFLLCGDWHRADDLTQIAFVKLYGAWERVRDRAALDAYVRSCLVRAVVDESRRPWRRERFVEVLPEPDPGGTGSEPDLAEMVADRDLLRVALQEVPPGQRTVLVLRYYEGMDVRQVAEALRCSEGTVKSQTARGLAALRVAVTASRADDQVGQGGDR
ncbi:SigE family RNA polymerase sigma factor [Nakamurella leprariae]|uniref:SigE family RNA polymerase sigma factor n=1 Tax=Nakamurella leprariae TaxID=2803911 RepID=A0A938YBM6_9ACTN|nr:SigE family RNA polymerase sigma factor [Nakamurella leprariae]MBM9466663.1 SigE family RNA polymerase sigma factor [Nakamurella leprariae]